MASEINKILLNVPQTLTDTQIANLKTTLADVIEGSGGSSGIASVSIDTTLTGDGTTANPLGVANYDVLATTDDLVNYYTKTETDNLVTGKYDTSAFAAISGNFLTAHQSLDGYATEDFVNAAITDKVDSSALDSYATKSFVDSSISGKLDTSVYSSQSASFITAHQSLSSYYTKTEVDDLNAMKEDRLTFSNDADGNITAINTSSLAAGMKSVSTNTAYIIGDGTEDNPLTIDVTSEGSWGKFVEDKLATISSEFTLRGQLTNAEVIALTSPTIGDAYVLSDTGDLGSSGDIVVYTETGWVEMPTVSVDLDSYLKTEDAQELFQEKLTDAQLSAISSVSSKLDSSALDGYATETFVADAIIGKLDTATYEADSGTFLTAHQSLEGYATEDYVASALSGKVDTSAIGTFATEDYVDEKLSIKLDTSSYSSQSSTFLTAHQSLEGYATETYVDEAVNEKLDTSSYSTVSSTFLTAHQSLEGYATTDDLDSKLDSSSFSDVSGDFVTSAAVSSDGLYSLRATGWQDISNSYYSKSEANGRFVITGNVTSGDATKTSGNGQNFKFTFIPMDVVTATPTADDGVLHIILES